MNILVLAEHDNGQLKAVTRNAVAAAAQLGGDVHVLVAGADCKAVAEQAAGLFGVVRVFVAQAEHLEAQLAEDVAAVVLVHAPGYSHLLAPATASGKSVMPRVAAMLDVSQVSEIVAVISPNEFVRPIYAGNVFATVRSADPVKVLTVRATAFDPVGAGGCATILTAAVPPKTGGSRLVAKNLAKSERPELTDASVIVSGGRGLGCAENYEQILNPLADKLGAALGASRAAVDAGYVPNSLQVGQTGKIVAPQLYFAVGISGAIQHLAGMKDSKVIVAINKDPEAPIFQVADYGLVADLFEAVPRLVEGL
jgi:electron transfer flavoprotein alpha subunit